MMFLSVCRTTTCTTRMNTMVCLRLSDNGLVEVLQATNHHDHHMQGHPRIDSAAKAAGESRRKCFYSPIQANNSIVFK